MSVQVVPFEFSQFYNGSETKLYCLRRLAGSQDLFTEADVAKEVEEASSLSKGDVTHVLGIFMSELRKILVRGDRVKISGLGTFYMTVTSESKANPEELSTRDIKRVNIRFLPDKALKLVNNSLASTRSDNNVPFTIKGKEEASDANVNTPQTPGDSGNQGNQGNSGNGGEDYLDPNA
jgi:predicted histone-like DNA-binding protein